MDTQKSQTRKKPPGGSASKGRMAAKQKPSQEAIRNAWLKLCALARRNDLTGNEYMKVARNLKNYRKYYRLNQTAAAKFIRKNVRAVQTFEAAGKWPKVVRGYIDTYSDEIEFSALNNLAREGGLRDSRTLIAALQRHIDGKEPRKRYTKKSGASALDAPIDPNIMRLEDKLRQKLGSKIEITDKEIVISYFGDKDQLDRIIEMI